MKLAIFFYLLSFSAFSGVDDYECLIENFNATVEHKAKPFGLFKNILNISKESCVVTIDHEKYKYLKNHWVIDVCREPVHIKQGTGALEIIKREGTCENSQTDYCDSLKSILSVVQDDGLIFAPGEKENIKSDHGKIYCTFLLLKKYLKQGTVLNKRDNSLRLLLDIPKPFIKPEHIEKAPKVDSPRVEEGKINLNQLDEKPVKDGKPAISF